VISLPSLFLGVHTKSAEHADLVGDLQSFLLGMDSTIKVDEVFGPKTQEAVKSFQRREGLTGDGVVGPRTWGVLLAKGFRPKSWQYDSGGLDPSQDPNWPPKPPFGSPNGQQLFGKDFTYKPATQAGYIVPDSLWVNKNITRVNIPQLTPVKGSPVVLFNSRLAFQLRALFFVWERLGLLHLVKTWGGSYVPRFIRGRTDKLSNHSFGSAFDINEKWNWLKKQPALLSEEGSVRYLVPSAQELGFYWGGHYNDGMHFEAYKSLSKEEVQTVVRRLVGKEFVE
jgi:hypothetical protein